MSTSSGLVVVGNALNYLSPATLVAVAISTIPSYPLVHIIHPSINHQHCSIEIGSEYVEEINIIRYGINHLDQRGLEIEDWKGIVDNCGDHQTK